MMLSQISPIETSIILTGSTTEQSATVLGIPHLSCLNVSKLPASPRKRPSGSQTAHQVKEAVRINFGENGAKLNVSQKYAIFVL